jgi:hypothetical protein
VIRVAFAVPPSPYLRSVRERHRIASSEARMPSNRPDPFDPLPESAMGGAGAHGRAREDRT